MTVTGIPPMTNKLGRHWQQPSREGILVDETHAVMTHQTYGMLLDYTHSQPTALYPGKMWRTGNSRFSYLHFVAAHKVLPNTLVICCRKVLFV